MASISIDQWRCTTGSFSGGTSANRHPNISIGRGGCVKVQNHGQFLLILAMMLVYANITQMLLVKEGVERNPGPNNGDNPGK